MDTSVLQSLKTDGVKTRPCIACGAPVKKSRRKRYCGPCIYKRLTPEQKERRRLNKIRFKERNPSYTSEFARKNNYKYQRKWKANNKDKVNSHTRTRQARMFATTVEFVDYAVVIRKAKGLCRLCSEPFGVGKIEIDHIVPLSRNGTHTYNNVQAVHAVCNRRKSDKLMDEVAQVFENGRR